MAPLALVLVLVLAWLYERGARLQARKRFQALAERLERNGNPDAADSIYRELEGAGSSVVVAALSPIFATLGAIVGSGSSANEDGDPTSAPPETEDDGKQ